MCTLCNEVGHHRDCVLRRAQDCLLDPDNVHHFDLQPIQARERKPDFKDFDRGVDIEQGWWTAGGQSPSPRSLSNQRAMVCHETGHNGHASTSILNFDFFGTSLRIGYTSTPPCTKPTQRCHFSYIKEYCLIEPKVQTVLLQADCYLV